MTTTRALQWGPLAQPIRQDVSDTCLPPWKDNAYVCLWDATAGVYGIIHVSTSPNSEGRRARASFELQHRIAEVVEELAPDTFESESISFGLDGVLRVSARDLQVDIRLTPASPPADFNRNSVIPALVPGEPLQHFQGAIRATGTVTLFGQSAHLYGHGLRDRTWGYRDLSVQVREYMAVVAGLGDGVLSILKVSDSQSRTRTEGYWMTERHAVPTAELTGITRDAAGLFAAATTTLDDREVQVQSNRRVGGFWTPMGETRQGPAMSAFSEFHAIMTADGRSGHGMVEQGIVRTLS